MLHDQKHVKRRKIGVLVSNLKDCTFNRISKRPYKMPNNETTPKQNPPVPKLNHQPAQSSLNQQPRLFADHPTQSSLSQQPRFFADQPAQSLLNQQPRLFADHHTQSSLSQQPRPFADQPAQSSLNQQPRLFAEVVKSSRNHSDSVDHETMLKLLNIYEMIRQS